MVVVARARALPPSEHDSIEPLGRELIIRALKNQTICEPGDPILIWFDKRTAGHLRALELSVRTCLIGSRPLTGRGNHLDNISAFAATFYVALFSICRDFAMPFKSSNPTWLKYANRENRLVISSEVIFGRFSAVLARMASALAAQSAGYRVKRLPSEICLADTTVPVLPRESVDFLLASPPYCTRIDYTAATRLELAVLDPLLVESSAALSAKMLGSTKVPTVRIEIRDEWGSTCRNLLRRIAEHPSKASSTYYLKTHTDYFHKLYRSICSISSMLKPGACAVLVVQNSFYKDLHNDLPTIFIEMAHTVGLGLQRRKDFPSRQTMAHRNPASRNQAPGTRTESVLCFLQ
jgi:hypothetical protein